VVVHVCVCLVFCVCVRGGALVCLCVGVLDGFRV
jgi:hypothetical protein